MEWMLRLLNLHQLMRSYQHKLKIYPKFVRKANCIFILKESNNGSIYYESCSITQKQNQSANQPYNQLLYSNTMSYKPDYMRSPNPLQNYYTNATVDPKAAQIKKVKSSENISLMKVEPQQSKPQQKKPFIEPGNPCENFEEILSTTVVNENGINTYFIAKALKGPLLSFSSQECKKKQQAKKPQKKIPEIPEAIKGSLTPHLEGYSTITHEGLYRQTNEDKITIYLEENAKWFSIYDGHGGPKCSQYLKENLHEFFFNLDWRKDIPNALRKAFIEADADWRKKGDNSGSCALVIFIYNNVCYTANLGDSRAIMISQQCSKCYQITKDHKPSNPDEQKRIIENGGKIYQTTAVTELPNGFSDMITGPLRVYPGRLSTTRTFGDFEAKESKENNPSKIVTNEPEISSFEIDEHDLIIMGSDGLWDKFENTQVSEIMKDLLEKQGSGENWYKRGAEQLLLESMNRGSTDNISVMMVGLNDPSAVRSPKKGNQHIKILSSISNNNKKRSNYQNSDKENSYPEKMKEIDSKILQINRNANRILQQSRRS